MGTRRSSASLFPLFHCTSRWVAASCGEFSGDIGKMLYGLLTIRNTFWQRPARVSLCLENKETIDPRSQEKFGECRQGLARGEDVVGFCPRTPTTESSASFVLRMWQSPILLSSYFVNRKKLPKEQFGTGLEMA